ncbi:MAG TPA: T9SS type A sorting domain-containing protein [Saprospiraceae bacterium]|nr:T9SS type A sorting domain-containing protein [Saprospiraceae bacterium]
MTRLQHLRKLQFATLWWADAVTPKEGTKSVYLMGGGATYPLKDKVMATLYKNDTFEVLTYFFDISLVNNFTSLVSAVKPVMVHFEGIVSAVEQPLKNGQKIEVFPNPVTSNQFILDLDLSNVATINANLFNSQGKVVKNVYNNQSTLNLQKQNIVDLEGFLSNGLYFLQINLDGKQQVTKPLLLLNAN